MPFYTYSCDSCHSTTTALRSVQLRNRAVRCACGKMAKKRQFETIFAKVSGSTSPKSLAQKLAGGRVMAPKTAGPTSVLGHACHSGCGCK